MMLSTEKFVTDLTELERLHDAVKAQSIAKEVDFITPAYQRMIEASPFLVVATSGPDGLDCSPRGDTPGFVEIADERTLLLPERRGNNRLDSMRNLLLDPRIALLFFIPGFNETLRVMGTARLCVDAALRERFSVNGNVPKIVLVIDVKSMYFQCARALVRSNLWKADPVARETLPSTGDILAEITGGKQGGAAYDLDFAKRLPDSLY